MITKGIINHTLYLFGNDPTIYLEYLFDSELNIN